jgi:hypothetical protein
MIKIYMNEKKWRIAIENEVWEFEDEDKMKKELEHLIDIKKTNGRLKNE